MNIVEIEKKIFSDANENMVYIKDRKRIDFCISKSIDIVNAILEHQRLYKIEKRSTHNAVVVIEPKDIYEISDIIFDDHVKGEPRLLIHWLYKGNKKIEKRVTQLFIEKVEVDKEKVINTYI